MTPFYVGQKVVCVNDSPHRTRGPVACVNGGIYTVVEIAAKPDENGSYGIALAEIRASPRGYLGASGYFRRDRFRPVVNTDISIFTAMLKTTKQGADA